MEPWNQDGCFMGEAEFLGIGNVFIQHLDANDNSYTDGNQTEYPPNLENGHGQYEAEAYWKSKYEESVAENARMVANQQAELAKLSGQYARAEKRSRNYGEKMLETLNTIDPIRKERDELKNQLISMELERATYRCEIECKSAVIVQFQEYLHRREEDAEILREELKNEREEKVKLQIDLRGVTARRRRAQRTRGAADQIGDVSSSSEDDARYAAHMAKEIEKELRRIEVSNRTTAPSPEREVPSSQSTTESAPMPAQTPGDLREESVAVLGCQEQEEADDYEAGNPNKRFCNADHDPVLSNAVARQEEIGDVRSMNNTEPSVEEAAEEGLAPATAALNEAPVSDVPFTRSSKRKLALIKKLLMIIGLQSSNRNDQSILDGAVTLAMALPNAFKEIFVDAHDEIEKILQAIFRCLLWNSPIRAKVEQLLEQSLGEWSRIDQQPSFDALILEEIDRVSRLQAAADLHDSGIQLTEEFGECVQKFLLMGPYCTEQSIALVVESSLASIMQWHSISVPELTSQGGVNKLVADIMLISNVALFSQSIVRKQLQGVFNSLKAIIFDDGTNDSSAFKAVGKERTLMICAAIELLTALPSACLLGQLATAAALLKGLIIELLKSEEIEEGIKQHYRKRYAEFCVRRAKQQDDREVSFDTLCL